MLTTADRVGFPHRREVIAIVVALLGFFLSFASVSFETRNGVVTSFSYFDFGKLIFGIITLVMAFNNRIFISEGEAKYKTIRIVLLVVLLAVGIYHVLGAFGVFIDPQAYVRANR